MYLNGMGTYYLKNGLPVDTLHVGDVMAFHFRDSDWPPSRTSYFEPTQTFGSFSFNLNQFLLDAGTLAAPNNPPLNVTSLGPYGAGTNRLRSSALTGATALIDDHIYTAGGSANPSTDISAFVLSTIAGP